MVIIYFILLSCLGLTMTAQAQDCSRPVPGANMTLRDTDINLQTFADGIKVTFVCDIGYTTERGSGVITCSAGSWSPLTLKCMKKSCGSPGIVDNGEILFPSGIDFGDKVTITCNLGFRLVGKSELFCGDKGWLGRLPVCEVIKCNPPFQIKDGTFDPVKDEYDYRDVIIYSCQKELTLNGSKVTTCSDDEKFHPSPPKCIKVECAELKIDNAEWSSGSRPPHKYMAEVIYVCNDGYKMEGEQRLTCNISSQWSPGIPRCKMVTCDPPPLIADGTFSPQNMSYQYGDVVEYSCHKGFTLSGTRTMSCSVDGTFGLASPTCNIVTCDPPPLIADGTFSPQKTSYQYGDVVEYSCHKGFTLSGSKSTSCSVNGLFDDAPPTCNKIAAPSTPPTTTPKPTGPTGSGNNVGTYVAVILVPLILVGGAIAAFLLCRKNNSYGKDHHDKKATNTEEEVALADGKGVELNPADTMEVKTE